MFSCLFDSRSHTHTRNTSIYSRKEFVNFTSFWNIYAREIKKPNTLNFTLIMNTNNFLANWQKIVHNMMWIILFLRNCKYYDLCARNKNLFQIWKMKKKNKLNHFHFERIKMHEIAIIFNQHNCHILLIWYDFLLLLFCACES